MPLPLAILAAGRGSRMDPLTRALPKPLLPVVGRPLLHHLVQRAVEAGLQEVVVVVHEGAEQVRASLGDGSSFGCTVRYVDQGEPQGTGHAVAALAGHIDDAFVMVSGDSLLSADDLRHLATADGLAVGGRPVQDVSRFGLLAVHDGIVTGVKEKQPDAGAGIANAGAYRLDADFIRACADLTPSPRGELELTDALQATIEAGGAPRFVACHSWTEAGRPWDLLDVQEAVMQGMESRIDGHVDTHVNIEGPVVIEAGARVLSGTRIEGPVFIGREAKIGPGAYVRPYTAIGARCHIGNSCEIKNSIIMEDTNIPHLSYVGDSVIGRRCNLGAGTQVANLKVTDRDVRVHWQGGEWLDTGRRKLGVVMGDDVKVGVNCSINPGTVLASGVRVGAGELLSGWVESPPERP